MILTASIQQFGELVQPASDEQIQEVQARLQCVFPREYYAFLKITNGFITQNPSLTLYAVEDLEERNTAYEVREYLPDYLSIGDNGGGTAILIDLCRNPAALSKAGFGALFVDDLEPLALSMGEWISRGFEWRSEEQQEEDAPGQWALALEQIDDTLQTLKHIRSVLGLSVVEIGRLQQQLPGILASGSYREMKRIQQQLKRLGLDVSLKQQAD